MKKTDWKRLLICLIIPLAVGAAAGLLIMNGMEAYSAAEKPPLSPPPIVFPIVWAALYILMGISSYLVYESEASAPQRNGALAIYGLQLAVNFVWPLIFFNMRAYFAAFLWLLLLLALTAYMIALFYRINKWAARLQLPYIAWLLFAAYLNLGVYLLNM